MLANPMQQVARSRALPLRPAPPVLHGRGSHQRVCSTSGQHLSEEHARPPAAVPSRRLSGAGDRAVAAHVCDTSRRPVVQTALGSPRPRIAVDVDEVLGRFVFSLNRFCKDHYSMDYDVHDYWIYEFAKIWKCDQEQSNHIVHEFFKSQHFNDGIPVIPGASEALERLAATHDLVVVTSRQHVIQDATLEWLDRHFPSLFQEVYFGNHFALSGVSRKKSDICRAIGARVLVDDNPSYAAECAAAGINVLLYDWNLSYPWSKLPAEKRHPLIRVVSSWAEVEVALAELAPELQAAAQASIGSH